jgi:hypothetical protein
MSQGSKQFSAAFLDTLKDALAEFFWFKDELRRFLTASLADAEVLGGLNWSGSSKRVIARGLVDRLAHDQKRHFNDIRLLTRGLLEVSRFPGLQSTENAVERIARAKSLQSELRRLVRAHNEFAGDERRQREYEFLKQEHERRKAEDDMRAQRRRREDELRAGNPESYFGRILRLKGKVAFSDVRRNYLNLIKAYHPDRFESLDEEFRELANRRTQQINEAFQYFREKYGGG